MENKMTIYGIIFRFLLDNRFDGLYNEDCGCCLENLHPCDENFSECMPGYKHYSNQGTEEEDWYINGEEEK